MEKAQIFLYTGLITAALIMTLNYKAVQYYESKRISGPLGVPEIPRPPRVCRDIFEIGRIRKNMSEMTNLGVRTIRRAKRRKTFLRSLYYEVLSYESPLMVRKTSPGQGIGGSNVTISKKWRFEQSGGQFSHMPCRLREYGPREVYKCTTVRQKSAKGTTHMLYIGDSRIRQHVEVMIDLLRDLDLKITTYKGEILSVEEFLGDKGMTHWKKYKHNFRVESLKAPGFIIDFNWAALIDWGDKPKRPDETLSYQTRSLISEEDIARVKYDFGYKKTDNHSSLKDKYGKKEKRTSNTKKKRVGNIETMPPLTDKFAFNFVNLKHKKNGRLPIDSSHVNGSTRVGAIDILKRLNSAPQESLPDIVLINSGAWLLGEHYITIMEHIDMISVVAMTSLKRLLKRLVERTTVVWLAPDPLKEHIQHIFNKLGVYTREVNSIQEWLLNAQALLQPPGVLFWDSFLPISYAGMQDCMHLSSEDVDFNQLPKYKVFQPLVTWHCLERLHIGFEVLSVAVQMALNHLCNPYLEKGYCCSS